MLKMSVSNTNVSLRPNKPLNPGWKKMSHCKLTSGWKFNNVLFLQCIPKWCAIAPDMFSSSLENNDLRKLQRHSKKMWLVKYYVWVKWKRRNMCGSYILTYVNRSIVWYFYFRGFRIRSFLSNKWQRSLTLRWSVQSALLLLMPAGHLVKQNSYNLTFRRERDKKVLWMGRRQQWEILQGLCIFISPKI